ncbi:multidrug effflux MFS transporter [Novosphingobium sp. TH158]|uniref:multidrug effflux MFS transporter n=1 Tax=Novosphingobium sp. TH158 TaxID=2067455 RepID=UPI000C7A4DEE|nr:multidrug effflux MFS transporter [Novosphingobium sp. TH158]PLK27584.1 Bcr/CflA subfamily drug resistance transporter [Novosphingobium sp. TH158]
MSPTPPPAPLAIGERELVFMLALLQALHAFAVDAMLPALGVISSELNVADPNKRQLIIGVFLIGLGLGSLFPGSLADRFGRKTVLLTCVAGYVVLSLASALVNDIDALIAMRFVLGLMSAGLSVVPPAIIRDRFEGDRMARLQSLISVIFLVVPMLAPTVGQGIMLAIGWRWIFGAMGLLGLLMMVWVWARLPETLHPEYRQPIDPKIIAANMREAVMTRSAIGYVLGSAFMLGVGWGYIQSSQQLVAEHFGAGALFPVIFGGMALAMACANFTNSRIVERFGARRVSHTALLAYLVVGSLQLWMASSGHQTLWQFVIAQSLTMMLMGFVGANFSSIALQPFARIAGAASSVQAFIRLALASLIGWAVGQSYDQTALPFSQALVISGLMALALVLFSERGRLFRRLNPPGSKGPHPV